MFCENCGNEIQDGQIFCSRCGTPVKRKPKEPYEKKKIRHTDIKKILIACIVILLILILFTSIYLAAKKSKYNSVYSSGSSMDEAAMIEETPEVLTTEQVEEDLEEGQEETTENSVDMKEILSTYEQYINDLLEYYDFEADAVLYELIYVDDDDIPECVAGFCGNSMLYIYKNGNITSVPDELFGGWSEISYKERTGEFMYSTTERPKFNYYYYKLDDGEVTLLSSDTEPGDEDDEYEYCGVYMDEGYESVWAAADAHGIKY